ncbi:MAG: hypothetical protein ACLPUG_15960 [Acidimicrobiales bacterium]
MGKSPIASLCALVVVGGVCLPLLAGCSSTAAVVSTRQVSELKGSGLSGGDEFGTSVAVSGATAVVGSPGAGRAYVFKKVASGWSQVGELQGSDATGGDHFGAAVAISGSTIVVGAYDQAKDAGRAYVFESRTGGWSQVAELKAADTVTDDYFGWSVAISGSSIVVGAVGHAKYTGSAYVFRSGSSGWAQTAELEGTGTTSEDGFGTSVGIAGSTAIVGAEGYAKGRGRAYVFNEMGSSWTESGELKAPDNAADDNFGASVAISSTTAVVGAYGRASSAGRAYVFQKTATAWEQTAELKGSDTAAGDYFGISVAISGKSILVGAYGHSNFAGRAYLFHHTGSGWEQNGELKGSNTTAGDYLGVSVAISGTTAVTGAYNRAKDTGAAYVFQT